MIQQNTQARAIALPSRLSGATLPVPTAGHDSLRQYMQAIAKFPVLSAKEERELADRWYHHQDTDAAHRLVTSYLRLVAKIASKYKGYGLPVQDLIAEGNIGLMQAVKRFEPQRGFRLSTYAMWWIKASIQEYVLKSWSSVKVGSSAAQKRLFFNLRKIRKHIGAASGADLTPDQVSEIARTLDVKDQDVVDMDRHMISSDVHLNTPMSADTDDEKMDFLADDSESHEDIVLEREEQSIRMQALHKAMEDLTEREREIFMARKLKDAPSTLEELSQVYKVSRERVRQIENKAFEKIQAAMLKNQKLLPVG